MGRWNGCVEFNAMLNKPKWNSFEIGIISCKNVLIFIKYCFYAFMLVATGSSNVALNLIV
jgi:hypothetical protein